MTVVVAVGIEVDFVDCCGGNKVVVVYFLRL